MSNTKVENARIGSTMLGKEDHGIWTAQLFLDFSMSTQAYGGHRLHGEWMFHFVSNVCETVGVTKWEDLPGKLVRVRIEGARISEIGNIVEDRWLDFVQFVEDLQVTRTTQDG